MRQYIQHWASNLHPRLSEDIGREIQTFLTLFTQKLHHLEGLQVLTQALGLFRSHLGQQIDDIKAPREVQVETTLRRLLLALGVQKKLTSDFVFDVVNKILAAQVIH